MRNSRYYRIKTCLSFIIFSVLTSSLFAGASDPPNVVPAMTIQYDDPQTSKQIVHEVNSYSDARKTYLVHAGVELTFVFKALNTGDNPVGDGVSIDVWLDWTGDEMPVDESDADFVCVPESPTDCFHFEETIKANVDFKGSDGKGVYNILIWVDRFDTQTEVDERDNIMGPVKIVAEKMVYMKQQSVVKPKTPVLKTPVKFKKSTE